MKKNIFKISSALLLSVFVLTSCNKTVTPRKLDGEWTVTAASGTTKNTNSGIYGLNSSGIFSFNGSILTSTVTYTGDSPITETTPMTIAYSFDKKAGTYTTTTIMTSTSKVETQYYKLILGTSDYDPSGTLDAKVVVVSTTIENGTFTITGGTGDIEKNTQIVLLKTSENTKSNTSYSYFDQVTSKEVSLTGKYTESGDALPTSESVTENHVNMSSTDGVEVLTVESLKKGVMEVTSLDSDNKTKGADISSISSNFKYTLTAK